MPNINKAVIAGHLGRDPELKFSPSGTAICNFSVATSSGKDDKRVTEWHRCVAFKELAEEISTNFCKGDAIHVEGSIRTRSWDDAQGVKRYQTEITVWYAAKPVYRKRGEQGQPRQEQSASGGASDEDIPF